MSKKSLSNNHKLSGAGNRKKTTLKLLLNYEVILLLTPIPT